MNPSLVTHGFQPGYVAGNAAGSLSGARALERGASLGPDVHCLGRKPATGVAGLRRTR